MDLAEWNKNFKCVIFIISWELAQNFVKLYCQCLWFKNYQAKLPPELFYWDVQWLIKYEDTYKPNRERQVPHVFFCAGNLDLKRATGNTV